MPNVVGSIPMAMSERFSLQHRIDSLHDALHEAQADLTKCKLERIDLDAALADMLARYSRLEALCHDLVAACESALSLLLVAADSMDEDCGERGCMCTWPGVTPCSQKYRDAEAECRAAIAKVKGQQ